MPARIKPIKGVPGYFVGSDGRVWSAWRTRGRKGQRGVESYIGASLKEMKLQEHNQGYFRVVLRLNGKYVSYLAHRLVLEAFTGPCPEGMEGCHKDGDKRNNRIGNLYWGTRRQNRDDAIRMDEVAFGERNSQARLTEEQVEEILIVLKSRVGRVYKRPTFQEIGDRFGVSASAISLINRGINWRRTKERVE